LELVLIQNEPVGWVNTAVLVLLGELRRRAAESIDWERLTDAGVVQMLHDFEVVHQTSVLNAPNTSWVSELSCIVIPTSLAPSGG
jgi:hypothetical protein